MRTGAQAQHLIITQGAPPCSIISYKTLSLNKKIKSRSAILAKRICKIELESNIDNCPEQPRAAMDSSLIK